MAFDTLETLVSEKYGAPQNMVNNGRIYRGFETSDGVCNNRVILTFYKSTSVIRIQGAGYALWINKVLPKLATKVMETLSQNGLAPQQKNASQVEDTATNLASPQHPRSLTSPHLAASTPCHPRSLTSASPHLTASTPCHLSTLTSASPHPTASTPRHLSTPTSASATSLSIITRSGFSPIPCHSYWRESKVSNGE